jgi:hypothetical protein
VCVLTQELHCVCLGRGGGDCVSEGAGGVSQGGVHACKCVGVGCVIEEASNAHSWSTARQRRCCSRWVC